MYGSKGKSALAISYCHLHSLENHSMLAPRATTGPLNRAGTSRAGLGGSVDTY